MVYLKIFFILFLILLSFLGTVESAFFSSVIINIVLGLPVAYVLFAFQNQNNSYKLKLLGIFLPIYFLFAFFPQFTYLPAVAVPLNGGYYLESESKMYYGTIFSYSEGEELLTKIYYGICFISGLILFIAHIKRSKQEAGLTSTKLSPEEAPVTHKPHFLLSFFRPSPLNIILFLLLIYLMMGHYTQNDAADSYSYGFPFVISSNDRYFKLFHSPIIRFVGNLLLAYVIASCLSWLASFFSKKRKKSS